MESDNIEATPSADSGNIPAEAGATPETPNESAEVTETEAKEAPTEAVPEEVKPELFELPDGRKVDGETLSREWKENFLPEFTKKSQALAEIEKSKQINTVPEKKPFQDPEWVPQTYEELIEVAKKEIKGDFEQQEKQRAELRQQLEDSVSQQLTELKKQDPTLNENALFLHANEYREKYGVSFPDLKSAYTHMKDLAGLTKTVQQTTAKNIAKRTDPVSTTPGAVGQKPDPGLFGNAVEYLRALK